MRTRWSLALVTCLALLSSAIPVEASTRARLAEGSTARDTRLMSSLDAGEVHTCGVNNDGTVRCWGGNSHGQLGDGSLTDRPTPVLVKNISTAVAVSAGLTHTCALLVNGQVRCWGENGDAQLGDTTKTDRDTPVTVSNVSNAVAITTGNGHTCALIDNGTVRCWGRNFNGQIGVGSPATRNNDRSPVTVPGLDNVTAIAAGADHTCALRADGSVRCWGFNGFGQLDDGTDTGESDTKSRFGPVPVCTSVTTGSCSELTNAVAIGAGANHTCAVGAGGALRCWRDNTLGQLGDGSTTRRLVATPVSGLSDVVTVTAGDFHTCILRALGTAVCWGDNVFGQLGDGTQTSRLAPNQATGAVSGLTNVIALSAGGIHTCALQADGSLRCWGSNVVGQLGDGINGDSATPNVVAGGAGSISGREIAVGEVHTCAVRANGLAACWGDNSGHQLGDGSDIDRHVPVAVSSLSNAVSLAAGDVHTCALRANGAVSCWGNNGFGQLGTGNTTTFSTPQGVTGLPTAIAVATGGDHTCSLLANGGVSCWGDNSAGQLGNPVADHSDTPVTTGLQSQVAIVTGAFHSCALAASGSVRCWGANADGRLGGGTTDSRAAPTLVGGLTNVIAIAAGVFHTCALRADGTVRCWGGNTAGQVGDGTQTSRPTPVPVIGLTNVVAISAGLSHTCALRSDGAARCWGSDSSGQLGNGTRGDALTPDTVSNITTAVAIAAGDLHTCVLKVNGAPACWGGNNNGQIGNNSLVNRQTQVQVGSFIANVEEDAVFASNGYRVLLTALVNCPLNQDVEIEITLVQGAIIGHGRASGHCRDRLAEYQVQVSVRSGPGFELGPADADLTATVRKGSTVVDVLEWERNVEIIATP